MKNVLFTGTAMALLVAAQAASAQPGQASSQQGPICLRTQDMIETQPQKGGASMIIKMRDGSVWRNDFRGRCPDLWFETGFAWSVINGDGTVCENQDSLHVLKSSEVCTLGKFTEVTPPNGEQRAVR